MSISNLPDLVANPKIVVSDENKYTLTKTVTIYYPGNQYTNEYSLDNGNMDACYWTNVRAKYNGSGTKCGNTFMCTLKGAYRVITYSCKSSLPQYNQMGAGLEGGNLGGEVIAEGTPEEIIKNKKSYTGEYLKKYL